MALVYQYKDRLFKAIFGAEENRKYLLMLYNALNNTNYTDESIIEITTIENVIYANMKNDLSFLIGSELNLYEQQSTYNPNMPLRGFMYYTILFQNFMTKHHIDIYSRTLVKLPTPRFIVIYNGAENTPDRMELHLSDAFEDKEKTAGKFEWTANLININAGHNKELLAKCYPLRDYAAFVDKVRENIKGGMNREDAVGAALDYAIKEGMLDGFFREKKMEVLNMSLTEFNQEEYDNNRRAEGRAEGLAKGEAVGLKKGEAVGLKKGRSEGRVAGLMETAKNMIKDHLSFDLISKYTGLSVSELRALQ